MLEASLADEMRVARAGHRLLGPDRALRREPRRVCPGARHAAVRRRRRRDCAGADERASSRRSLPTVLLVTSAKNVYLSSTFVRETATLGGMIVPGSVRPPSKRRCAALRPPRRGRRRHRRWPITHPSRPSLVRSCMRCGSARRCWFWAACSLVGVWRAVAAWARARQPRHAAAPVALERARTATPAALDLASDRPLRPRRLSLPTVAVAPRTAGHGRRRRRRPPRRRRPRRSRQLPAAPDAARSTPRPPSARAARLRGPPGHPGHQTRNRVQQGGIVADADGSPSGRPLPFVAVHYGDLTSLIGAPGNAVIAGHVVTLSEGNVFRFLYQLDIDDQIQVWDQPRARARLSRRRTSSSSRPATSRSWPPRPTKRSP